MGDHFAFLLPVIMATFGCAFLFVWRSGPREALYWGVANLLGAVAFSCPVILEHVSDAAQTIVSDALFSASFFFYNQALLVRYVRPRAMLTGLAISLLGVGGSVLAVLVFDSLRLELMSSDATCAILSTTALVSIRKAVRHPVDRAVFAISVVNVADNLIRGGLAPFLTATDNFDAYMASTYAFFEQASGAVTCLVFGLTALAAVTLDVVAGYRRLAMTDPLTGMLNRRGFETLAPDLARIATPQGSVLTCDIDHFKRVNDTLGHAVGDRVIMAVAELLRAALPPDAVAARFGGEEFVVYLPQPDSEARLLADQLRQIIAAQASMAAGVQWRLTASFGLTQIDLHDTSLHDTIARADRGLYEAKLAGRNQVVSRAIAA